MESAGKAGDLYTYRYFEPFELLQRAAGRLLADISAGHQEGKLKEELQALARAFPASGLLQNFNRFFQKIPANSARVQAWLEMTERHQAAAAGLLAAHLEQFDSVLVYSHSDLIRLALTRAGKPLSVFCMEARPSDEGVALAEDVSRTHHRAYLVTDIAAFSVMNRVDCVVLGCSGFTDTAVVAKIGSSAVCSSARSAGRKVYVATTSEARLEDWRNENLLPQGPPSEIYAGKAVVTAENYCLDLVPIERIDGMFLESNEKPHTHRR